MIPTRKRLLFMVGVVGLLCGVTAARLYLAVTAAIMSVRITTPVALAIMALVLLWWTLLVRRRLVHIARARHQAATPGAPFKMQDQPLDPMVAARTVALAFAASRAGSYVCGFYAGVGLIHLGYLDAHDLRWSLAYAIATAMFAFVLVIIALWLERSCKLPGPPLPNGDTVGSA